VFCAIFFAKKGAFWAAQKATKIGPVSGRPGIRFAVPKIITKGARIFRKFREN
jgi:hypothetical protein